MKKTLVALAVLAASSASFAQVALTGAVAMGWAGLQDAAGNQSSGLGVDTATLDFASTEDLGGGMKLVAHLGFDTLDRGGVVGGDTGMTLSTSAFALTLGSNQLGDYLQGGNANVSGTFNSFEGRVLGAKPNKDFAGVSAFFGPVTLSVTEYEAANGLGLGTGSGGPQSSNGSRNTQYQIAYKSGPLGADAAFKSYDNVSTGATTYTTKSIVRGAVSYDFGVAKVGAGISSAALQLAGTDTGTVLSATAPMGAITLGGQYISRVVSGTTGGDYTQTGYGLEFDYSFSKQTKVSLSYLNWQPALGGAGSNASITELALVKSF